MMNGRDSIVPEVPLADARMVVYFDSTRCASCSVHRLHEWGEMVDLSKKLNGRFIPIFIFTPATQNISELITSLQGSALNYPMIIDNEKLFPKLNAHIPSDNRMHTFLIDKNNQVVLVGSPVENKSLYQLYLRTIQELIVNNGGMKSSPSTSSL